MPSCSCMMLVERGMKIYNNNIIKFSAGSFKVILFVVCIFGIIIPLFIQVALLLQQSTVKDDTILTSHKILFEDLEVKKTKVEALEKHLKELEAIKIKALEGLMELDAKRVVLLAQIRQAKQEKNDLKDHVRKLNKQAKISKREYESSQQSKIRKVITNIVYVGVPQRHAVNANNAVVKDYEMLRDWNGCNIQKCFDFSKCSILNKFTFHLYKPVSEQLISIYKNFIALEEYSDDWKYACVVLVLIDITQDVKVINKYLSSLPSWQNTGHNHVLILELGDDIYCEIIKHLQIKHAILVMNKICNSYRKDYDFLVTNLDKVKSYDVKKEMGIPLYPIHREYILFFASQFLKKNGTNFFQEEYIVELNSYKDVFIKTSCNKHFLNRCSSGWCTCDFSDGRKKMLKNSLFSLILIDVNNPFFVTEIIDSFKNSVIPVFVGLTEYLPFSDVIDWKQASVMIPLQRLPELLLVLRSMPLNDIISLKLQGQFLYTTYFSSKKSLIQTILTNLQSKIGLTPAEFDDFPAVIINNATDSEKPEMSKLMFSSPRFAHNFSFIGKNQYMFWNRYPGALRLFPVTPWNEPAPSTIQFLDEGKDYYMPIGDGTGGDGVAFSRSLGGDYPIEQFTILMLTYDREAILMEALQRLSGLKYLNKVVVVWNHPINPADNLEWPDIGVKIDVIRAKKNSLNNRFIPYDVIETEAILSMDDDIYLRHGEIELAFRVWRENRERLVGFPGRHHSYNSTSKSFYYNSEHSCELSLVLTGGAFFHKYYSYIYTYYMNSVIREMVDGYMNCEDIAMNFLVAHITKKPPIKVTSRWTFKCPGCPAALSADAHHYDERNSCMSYFEKLYGYNPLKRTQFRADSILFKTRLPSTMTKCFQFV